jgi:glycosyltransferase involved in cell wall biosynthesis
VDAVVGVSSHVLNRVTAAGFFPQALKAVVYNARYIPDISKKREMNQNSFVFGFIGTLSRNKGIEWLLSEFKRIESHTVFLKIAGKGDTIYEERLKKLIGDDRRICFLGFCTPEDFYPSIDVLVVPSIGEEALGMVAIEACAYCVPVITSSIGGLKEIIKDEYNGLYCNTDDPNTLSTAMCKIINDRYLFEKLRSNARISVQSFLDIKKWIFEYDNIYTKLTKRRGIYFQ